MVKYQQLFSKSFQRIRFECCTKEKSRQYMSYMCKLTGQQSNENVLSTHQNKTQRSQYFDRSVHGQEHNE